MSQKPKLLDQVRETLRIKHYALRTEQAYVNWIKRFILFHDKRHPREMGVTEVRAFLAHLSVEEHVSASTQTQALSALLFLYRQVLNLPLDDMNIREIRARKPKRLPTVLTQSEVQRVLAHLTGNHLLMARCASTRSNPRLRLYLPPRRVGAQISQRLHGMSLVIHLSG